MKKPANVLYGVEERPPLGVTVATGVQHAALLAINLVYPVLVVREAGGSPELVTHVVGITMLVLGLGTLAQASPRGLVGSGFLCPPCTSAIYVIPSLLAARRGGLPLVFGMTLFAGAFEAVLSRTLRHVRPFFPPEVAGLVVTMVGVTAGALGVRTILTPGPGQSAGPSPLLVAGVTLGLMIAFNVWSRGAPRLFCVLIGMAGGYVVSAVIGGLSSTDVALLAGGPLVSLPLPAWPAWAFDPGLAIAFGAAAVAATLKAAANITMCQRLNDAEWRRADMASVSGGVLADGLTTVLAGLVGTMGLNTSSPSVGLANATGVLSRHAAYMLGVVLMALAFVPKLGALLYLMPAGVAGAALLFASAFMFVNGLEIMLSRLIDARRTMVIGLALILGLSVDLNPALFHGVSGPLGVLFGSSLVVGTMIALGLNLIFRLGARRTQALEIDPKGLDSVAIETFMERNGAAWGARRDVIERAAFNLAQAVETIVDACEPQGPLTVEARFDEFNLDLRISYAGTPLQLPERRPTNEEIMASDEGQQRLAGFLLRRQADRVNASHRDGRVLLDFHFDH